jgi:hypothetical protein
MRSLTTLAWRSAGGSGAPPQDLLLAFSLNLSAFTTHALIVDFDRTPAQIGTLTAQILKMLLRRAVEAQREPADADGREAWPSSALTDIQHQGQGPGKDVHYGDHGTEEAPSPSVVHPGVQG